MPADGDRPHVFDRNGLAAVSDLDVAAREGLLGVLDREQSMFLGHAGEFRSAEYRWPRDALHTWSRVWEYPYAYHHLTAHRNAVCHGARVVDVGSGVTFFPFALAHAGYRVTCGDVDPVCARDLGRAIQCVPQAPGEVEFRPGAGERLPLADGEADAACCISVLEHLPRSEPLVGEVARVLKPRGLFVLTVGLEIAGGEGLGLSEYGRLRQVVGRHFEPVWPEAVVHPLDVLTPEKGPYGRRRYGLLSNLKFALVQSARVMAGRLPRPRGLPHLAALGLVLRSKCESS